jgi:hypothetical protein
MGYEVFKENPTAEKLGYHISIDLFLKRVFALINVEKGYSYFLPNGQLKNLEVCADDEEEVTGYFTY